MGNCIPSDGRDKLLRRVLYGMFGVEVSVSWSRGNGSVCFVGGIADVEFDGDVDATHGKLVVCLG